MNASFFLVFSTETLPGARENTKKAAVFSRAKCCSLFLGEGSSFSPSAMAWGSKSDWKSFSSYSVM